MAGLALIVRSAPWQERSGREALDLAMSALAMDVHVNVFFIGNGLLQLIADQQPVAAGLPPGQKAWAGLEALGDVALYAHTAELDDLLSAGLELTVSLESVARLERGGMPPHQAGQQIVVV